MTLKKNILIFMCAMLATPVLFCTGQNEDTNAITAAHLLFKESQERIARDKIETRALRFLNAMLNSQHHIQELGQAQPNTLTSQQAEGVVRQLQTFINKALDAAKLHQPIRFN